MQYRILTVIFLFCVFSIKSQTQKDNNIFKRVKINNVNQGTLQKIGSVGVDLECGANFIGDDLIVELTGEELHALEDLNILYQVEIDDLTKFYSERALVDMPKAIREFEAEREKSKKLRAKGVKNKSISEIVNNIGQYTGENEISWNQPINWEINTGSPNFGGCLTHDQVLQELDDMRTLYPNLISAKANASPSNQTTVEGRTVYFVRISDNPDIDENEPETLYQSLIHSREAGSVMQLLYFMWYVLENYDSDPAIRALVNNQELYFIPIFNPDGFVYNQSQAPNGGGGQRKNRNTSASGSCSTYLDGIDLNRNSAYFWGNGGSSTSSCNDTYMGTGQFSENETQIMEDFFSLHDFELSLNHHSYKNAMLHAYAGVNQSYPTVDGSSTIVADMYSKYNHDMTYYNRYMYGPSTQVTSLNSGNMNDWMLGGPAGTSSVTGTSTGTGSGKFTLAWTPENGLYSEGSGGPGGSYQGFWPAPSLYDDIAKRAMRANFMAAYFSGKYAKLHDMTPSNIIASGNLSFGIENLGRTDSDFTVTVTPISGLTSVGTAVTESGMSVLEQRYVNISFVLSAGIQVNDKIEYKVALTNDNASDNVLYEANIVKYYQPTELFSEGPNETLGNWSGSGWSTTATSYLGSSAISSGSYTGSSTDRIQLTGSYDFTNGSEFLIQYFAKWDIERSFDYVQIEASTNGSSWTPLVGKYTKPGAPDANNNYSNKNTTSDNFQPDYEHLYDGDTAGKWVMEEIVIDGSTNSSFYNQGTVYLRFEFRSDSGNRQDSYVNADFEGFQFDDFRIIKGPCEAVIPTNVVVSSITSNTATIDWDNVASSYDLRYRETGTSTWTDVSVVTTNTQDLSGLTPSTEYEVQVRSICDTSISDYSSSIIFTTTAVDYCDVEGQNFSSEFISNVKLEAISNSTPTAPSNGYTDFTGSLIFSDLDKSFAGNYTIEISKGFVGGSWNEAVAVWIDMNKNGTFETVEKIFNSTSSTITPISTTFNVLGATVGQTRMRVILKYYNSAGNNVTDACETTFQYGEVEDYTVNIIDSTLGIEDEILSTFNLYPNPSNIGEVRLTLPNEIQDFNIEIYNILGQKLSATTTTKTNQGSKIHTINTSGFKTGVYFVRISTELGSATKKLIIE